MEKSFLGQEDQMSKLRTEVGANLNSLNYDISGLLQFKNESGEYSLHKIVGNQVGYRLTFQLSGFNQSKSQRLGK